MKAKNKTDVFIIGSKGIPARYGGYETFVDKWVQQRRNPDFRFHVTGMGERDEDFHYRGVHCHNFSTPSWLPSGPRAVLYNLRAITYACRLLRDQDWKNGFIYQLSSRLGPFIYFFNRRYAARGFQLLVNPDGLEWKRQKWSRPVRWYWRLCEASMVRAADHVICDSLAIQKIIRHHYRRWKPKTTFIAYGAEPNAPIDKISVRRWLAERGLKEKRYYLAVGRFEPENNIELIIREYLKTGSPFPLVLISNFQKNAYYRKLEALPGFRGNKKILLPGPIYQPRLLSGLRKQAFAYLHGHEVGGTNPSLLEALALTPLSLVLDVEFNQEAAGEAGIYFTKEPDSLARAFRTAESLSPAQYGRRARAAAARIRQRYTWPKIAKAYDNFFKIALRDPK